MGCHKNYHRRLQNNNHAKGGIEMGGGGNDSVDANVEIGGGVDLTVASASISISTSNSAFKPRNC